MMRRLAARHRGILPLDTAENIWRIIISTFTYVQAPFSVHADVSAGDGPMRGCARFHFGFTVPYVPHAGAAAVIGAVARSQGDLGIFRPDQKTAVNPWWEELRGPSAPKIIARLPFIERPDHPAGTPLYVVSKPLEDAAVRETVLVAARVERWREDTQQALARAGAEISGSAGIEGGLSLLVAIDGASGGAAVHDALAAARVGRVDVAEIGSHAKTGQLVAAQTDLVAVLNGHTVAVTRQYDSLDQDAPGTFGNGWRLMLRDVNLETSDGLTGALDSLRTGSRVYLTLPTGERVGFTFTPVEHRVGGLVYYTPSFTADAGEHARVLFAAADPARHEQVGQPRRAVRDDRRAVGGDDLQQIGFRGSGQQRDHQRVGGRLDEEVAESLQERGVHVADVGADRVLDLADEPVGEPQRVALGEPLA